MRTWRLLATGARPGRWNMACDAALLAVAATPTLRLYAWDPPAVSLGHHQAAPGAAEIARLTSQGLDWVRRPTGGRAVYHGGPGEELTYSVVAPIGDGGFPGGLADAYRRIHQAIAAGLGDLGAEVECVRRSNVAKSVSPSRRLACFAATVPWEITAGGRKLVGSAQRRSRRALLQHGSIPLAGDRDVLEAVWPGSLPRDCSTTLSAAARRIVDFDETAQALTGGFERTLGVRLEPGPLTRDEKERLRTLLPAASFA